MMMVNGLGTLWGHDVILSCWNSGVLHLGLVWRAVVPLAR